VGLDRVWKVGPEKGKGGKDKGGKGDKGGKVGKDGSGEKGGKSNDPKGASGAESKGKAKGKGKGKDDVSIQLSTLWVGQRVQVLYPGGAWYAADIWEISSDSRYVSAPVSIHCMGGNPNHSEWVSVERLWQNGGPSEKEEAKKTPTSPTSVNLEYDMGDLVQAMADDGYWYPGRVVQVKVKKHSAAPFRVSFSGYDSEEDEWMGSERIKVRKAKGKGKGKEKGKGEGKGKAEGKHKPERRARSEREGFLAESSIFAAQLEALQGDWAEKAKPKKKWSVDGPHAQQEGEDESRCFSLVEGENGGLLWGMGAKYTLDGSFAKESKEAVWRSSRDGSVAFTWMRKL